MYLYLMISTLCNLSCRYCEIEKVKYKPGLMDAETALPILSKSLDLEKIFYIGKEPLYNFGLIKRIAEEEPTLSFHFTTNGTMLNEGMKNFFWDNKNRFDITLSLDGRRDIHNANRCNSYDNIDTKWFRQFGADISMVVATSSIGKLWESLEHCYELGFTKVKYSLDSLAIFDMDHFKLYIVMLKRMLKFYKENTLEPPIKRKLWGVMTPLKECPAITGEPLKHKYFDIDGNEKPCLLTLGYNLQIQEGTSTRVGRCINCPISSFCGNCVIQNLFLNNTMDKIPRRCNFVYADAWFLYELYSQRNINGLMDLSNRQINCMEYVYKTCVGTWETFL